MRKYAWIAALVALLTVVVYQLATLTHTYQFGGYEVRRNRLTGIAEVRDGATWTRFADDPYADPIPSESLRHIRLENIAWGPGGLLCARATNRGTQPLTGRLAFHIVLYRDDKFFRDRAVRATVNFPPGVTRTIIVRTNLATPEPKIVTRLRLQPSAYSGM